MPIEHPLPTVATIKLLYARASCCAYPNCTKPLYQEDSISGVWALNSRICHIHARRAGGPRWDPKQPAEENRADGNLLLMCPVHASNIDSSDSIGSYPADLLRKWKDNQIADYRSKMNGWPLTTVMAEQAQQASISGDISIQATNIKLSGEGGQAPGAGGGGGGAIGHGSRAGTGGPGGRHYFFGSSNDEHMEITSQPPDDFRQAPGAGGGGAGAYGPNSVAGDGGGGGDSACGRIDVVPGDIIKIEVGDGGKGAHLPGQHAARGGDTVLRQLAADGTLKRVIRVKGGEGAKAGALPGECQPITDADVQDGFHITALLPVNAAEFREGLLFMLGAGWSRYPVQNLPQDAVWKVLCSASWSILSTTHDRGLHLCLLDPQGTEVSRIPLIIAANVIACTNVHWLAHIGAVLNAEGLWILRIQSDELILCETGVTVTRTT